MDQRAKAAENQEYFSKLLEEGELLVNQSLKSIQGFDEWVHWSALTAETVTCVRATEGMKAAMRAAGHLECHVHLKMPLSLK